MPIADGNPGFAFSRALSRCYLYSGNYTDNSWLGTYDPTNHTAISEKIMLLFDGKTIEQNSVSLHPRTSFMTSINMPCFEKLAKHHRYMNVKFVL